MINPSIKFILAGFDHHGISKKNQIKPSKSALDGDKILILRFTTKNYLKLP